MAKTVDRVVVFTQENHTTDNYFTSLRAWGANVATGWPTQPNPPAHDQAHTRAAYAKWLHAHANGTATSAAHTQIDTDAVLPYYAWLAKTGAFCENHCSGFGTNSTPNHLLIIGGQSPTLRNPPRTQADPVWDMPSLPGHAAEHGLTWKAYTGSSSYPVNFYQQLNGSPNIVRSDDIVTDAQHARLPELAMVWHDSPYDEHPVADVTRGQGKIWQAVDAFVTAGLWDTTVFLLSWDDWGGYDDHVLTPNLEHTPDGVQLAYGPRVPLLMFGGPVKPGLDSRWNGHTTIGKTVLDLLGLPPLGVPRLDTAPTLADLVDTTATPSAPPPAYGTTITQPTPPSPAPTTNTRPTATLTGLSRRRPGDTARRQHPPAAERPARHLTRHRPSPRNFGLKQSLEPFFAKPAPDFAHWPWALWLRAAFCGRPAGIPLRAQSSAAVSADRPW